MRNLNHRLSVLFERHPKYNIVNVHDSNDDLYVNPHGDNMQLNYIKKNNLLICDIFVFNLVF